MIKEPLSSTLPIVSVVAISYNQAGMISETLNSIFDQDYPNIELIICDDNSTDETFEIAKDWLSRNRNRFVSTRLISNPSNIGVCRNFALGYSMATGDWIKPLACDDLLFPSAISTFVETAKQSGAQLLFSQMQMFSDQESGRKYIGYFLTNPHKIALFSNPKNFEKELRLQNYLPAPGSFFSKKALFESGGVDLQFKHLDDWPLWLNFAMANHIPFWIPDPQVLYRISSTSISQTNIERPISSNIYPDLLLFYFQYQRPYLHGLDLWERKLNVFRMRIVYEKLGNTRFAYNLALPIQLLSPVTWRKIYKKFFNFTN